jgi:two-component system cell cycle sensor histidine kinase/response regulator CckA
MVNVGTEENGQPSSTRQTNQNSAVVLLVEDEDVVREITARVLESAGYRVVESSNPNDALRLAGDRSQKIDLLLTDIVMPGMSGVELADRLLSLRPDLITVFMSGYANADVLRQGLSRSAMHIQKPFTVKSLISRIAEALTAGAGRHARLHSTGMSELSSAPNLNRPGALPGYSNPPVE